MNVEGGAETQVLDQRVGRRWAVVESGIYFFNWQRDAISYAIEFFDFATRRTDRLATIEGQSRAFLINGMTISPDERWIVYEQRDQLEFDLVLVENFR